MIKTYRGLLADGAQDKIPLSTKDGSVGYRIVKFQTIPREPFNATQESTTKIYKTEQTTINGIVNFTDNDLLAVAIFKQHDTTTYMAYDTVIFDSEIFNQDIYITHSEIAGNAKMNYYIELEQMKLDQTQNMSATLKAIRGSAVD